MKRKHFTSAALVFGIGALTGCVPPPPPAQVAAAPAPVVAPPTVTVAPPPAVLVWAPVRHHVVRHRTVRVVRHVVHHRWVHRYALRTRYWTPRCGSTDHPCTVDHLTAPIQ